MATEKQITYIGDLLRRYGMTRDDLLPPWDAYEDLEHRDVERLISWLTHGENEDSDVSDQLAWKVTSALLSERREMSRRVSRLEHELREARKALALAEGQLAAARPARHWLDDPE